MPFFRAPRNRSCCRFRHHPRLPACTRRASSSTLFPLSFPSAKAACRPSLTPVSTHTLSSASRGLRPFMPPLRPHAPPGLSLPFLTPSLPPSTTSAHCRFIAERCSPRLRMPLPSPRRRPFCNAPLFRLRGPSSRSCGVQRRLARSREGRRQRKGGGRAQRAASAGREAALSKKESEERKEEGMVEECRRGGR